jgi:pyridoxine 4-dehydrogenase
MKTKLTGQPAARSGTFSIGGDLPVHRLGFGTMRLTGEGIWGEPSDHREAIAVLRRAVELGITLIDTADSYCVRPKPLQLGKPELRACAGLLHPP